MAYVVTADDGYSELSIAEIDYNNPDFSSISATSFDYSNIEASSFQRMWSAGGGYVDAKHTSSDRVDNNYKNVSGSSVTSEGGTYDLFISTPHLYVFSFTWNGDLYVMWLNASSSSDLENKLTNFHGLFPTSNTLYKNTVENAISQGVIAEESTWEDNTDPNYDPSISQGGENADLDQIYSDDIDPFAMLLPSDPEANLSHQNIRMMQPYLLSASQWLNLGYLFWQDAGQGTSFFDRLKEIMSKGTQNPMDAIAGLIRLPLTSSAISHTGSASDIYLGSLKVEGIGGAVASGHWINSRWSKLAYMIDIKEVFGTDYDYTKTRMHIYLPYVGQQELNTAEVMNGKLYAQYIIDVYTGDLICNLTLYKNMYGKMVKSSIARYKGNCALPMFYSKGDTQSNTQNIYNGLLSFGGAVASNNLQGGLSAMGNMAFGERVHVQKSGSVSGASGWCDVQYPYLIIERQVPLYANEWRKINGAVQWATFTVSALTGFTKFHEIHVHIPGASDEEKNEIESIMKSGIIL